MISRTRNSGALLILVLLFGSVFFMMVVGLLGYVITQYRVQELRVQRELAREIAEAGLNYYKWFLAHYPGDVTHGTGNPGPFTIPFSDPELGRIGEFEIALDSTSYCGAVSAINISSTGRTDDMSAVERTVYGRYARPTVAEYSFIINANVWAGPDIQIIGPYHSNGGIRMDGTNNSTVTSQQSTWTCTATFGCSPSGTRNGVFTTTSNPNTSLFNFPSVPINFTGLTVNLVEMQNRARNNGGIHLGPSGDFGYLIEFRSNNRIDVSVVDRTWSHTEESIEDGTYTAYNLIREADFLATYTIPADCPLIFVEDKVWLQGVVPSKVTIAAADVDTVGVDPSIILNGNITYATSSAGLLAIAEEDVLIGYNVPNNMTLYGIFIAQNGKFGRNHYETNHSNGNGSRFRNSLTMHGTVVSNGRVGTKWTSNGAWVSGFDNRYNTYDRNLVDDPPPLTPHTSDDYTFVEWRDLYQ